MDTNTLASLFAYYSNEKIAAYTPLPKTTSGNDAYVINTSSHTYVLRILAHQGAGNPAEEYALQSALRAADIVTPLYKKNHASSVVTVSGGIACTVSDYIAGERLQRITAALAASMGETLAKVQAAMSGIELTPHALQWFDPANVAAQLEAYNGPRKRRIAQLIERSSAVLNRGLPEALIHGDLHIHNIFARGDEVSVVFDLETVSYTCRILDIARTYLTLVKGSTIAPDIIMQALTAGFDSASDVPLESREKVALRDACVYVAAVTALSIYNNGNAESSQRYVELACDYAR